MCAHESLCDSLCGTLFAMLCAMKYLQISELS